MSFRFRGITAGRLLLLAETGLLLIAAKIVLRAAPFRTIAPKTCGDRNFATKNCAELMEIGWAFGVIARRIGILRQCLAQSIAAQWMLNRRRIANTLYLGVRRDEEGALLAHAWVRAGARTIVGRESRPGFHVIATFGDEEMEPECAG